MLQPVKATGDRDDVSSTLRSSEIVVPRRQTWPAVSETETRNQVVFRNLDAEDSSLAGKGKAADPTADLDPTNSSSAVSVEFHAICNIICN